jgi:hypothetical protein
VHPHICLRRAARGAAVTASTQVNIGINAEKAGFVIDLSEHEGDSHERRIVGEPAGPLIEHESAGTVLDDEGDAKS